MKTIKDFGTQLSVLCAYILWERTSHFIEVQVCEDVPTMECFMGGKLDGDPNMKCMQLDSYIEHTWYVQYDFS